MHVPKQMLVILIQNVCVCVSVREREREREGGERGRECVCV